MPSRRRRHRPRSTPWLAMAAFWFVVLVVIVLLGWTLD